MPKKQAVQTILVEVPIAPIPERSALNLNNDIGVDIRLDQRQSDALRHIFAGLKASMKYPLHRPQMGLVWFLEEVAAQIAPKDE